MSGPSAPATEFDLLSSNQAGNLLGISGRTLSRYADRGELPVFTTLGGHRRFRRSDVEALRDRMVVAAQPDGDAA